MAIIEEPFSIGRLLRPWFGRSANARRPSQRDTNAAGNRPAGPPDEGQAIETTAPIEASDEAGDGLISEAEDLGDPSILSEFNYSVTNCVRTADGALWVEHLLICNACVGGDMFSILSFPKVAPETWDEKASETVHCAPWNARCVECGAEKTIFDPRTGGRGPVLNGESGDAPGPDEATEETSAVRVYVSLAYQAKLDELQALAAKANVPAADLFDTILVRGVSPHWETIFEGLHECS